MNIFPFKVMIMRVLILEMLSLLKLFLKSCFKMALKQQTRSLKNSQWMKPSCGGDCFLEQS